MKIIGHRGAKGLAPENTLAGIQKAIAHGVDAIEIDVRITQDNVAVLLHNPTANDIANTELSVRACTYAELKAHKPDLTTLAEAMKTINRRVPVIIELKPHEPTEPVIAVIQRFVKRGWKPADIQFISFDYQILKTLHHAFPEHTVIVDEMWSSVRAISRARRLGSRHISLYRPFLWSGLSELSVNAATTSTPFHSMIQTSQAVAKSRFVRCCHRLPRPLRNIVHSSNYDALWRFAML